VAPNFIRQLSLYAFILLCIFSKKTKLMMILLAVTEIPVLFDIAVLFGVAVAVVMLCNLLKIPYIIGYLLTGILVGPSTFNIISEVENVETFAEIGVILLLFTVGLEFSFSNLMKIRRYVLLGGLLQVLFTIGITALLITLMGRSLPEAVFWGFVTALSSTAIVVKLLQDRMEINSGYGKAILAMLLFQDIAIVPLMLLTPILAGNSENVGLSILMMVVKLLGIALLAVALARFIIPKFFRQVMKAQNQEVFLIATIMVVLAITLLTQRMGLSLALGAFIAGLIIAETDYNHLAISCMLPFRYVFISFFFISMGMLLDYRVFLSEPAAILFWFAFIMLVKVAAGFLAARALAIPLRTALMVGLGLAQIGEFSFILARSGLDNQLITVINYQVFLAVSILTMAVTPFLIANADKLSSIIHLKKAVP
jgi:CPA2 family monovalent cation:H+ antiporter-2